MTTRTSLLALAAFAALSAKIDHFVATGKTAKA